MSKLTDRIKAMASKLSWPKRKLTPPEKKQESRWEGEGGSVHPEDDLDESGESR